MKMSYLISEPAVRRFGLVGVLEGFARCATLGAGNLCLVARTLPVFVVRAAGGDAIDGVVDLISRGQCSHLLTRFCGLHQSDD